MTTMSVRTFMKVGKNLPCNISVLLRAIHGIGKSQVVRQLGRELGFKPEDIIDRRLSQMSEGDVIGLPSTDGETTRFNPPDWYRAACRSPKVLFLDELNRATPEVMQACFQIVLDRELNGCKLHPQTRVYAAINNSAAYNVNEIDPALLDRFWVIDLNPDTQDWLAWARSNLTDNDKKEGLLGEQHVHPTIIDHIATTDKWLDPPKNGEPGAVSPSRRSWERLSQALISANIADEPDHELFYPTCLGFIGTEATIAFHDFAKNYDARVTGEEILNKYPKVRSKVVGRGVDKLNACIDKLAEHVIKNCEKLTDKQAENLKSFMTDLSGELRISCWSKLTAQGIDKIELAKSIHKNCAELVLQVFGVPMGAAGVGVTPNIPGIFKDQAKAKK